MYLVFDIGCIECGESSNVVGVYDTRVEADIVAEDWVSEDDYWGRPEWGGQHSVEVFELPPPS